MMRTLIGIFLKVITAFLCLYGRSSAANPTPIWENNGSRPAALFVFGDSILDTGNNNGMFTMVKSDFSPYGRDFMDGKPNGRFSNGRIPSDILAELLDLKKYLPAYLDKNLKADDLLSGVGFASGATGYDPLTSLISAVISMTQQLNFFKLYKEKLAFEVGRNRADEIVAESIYLVSSGNNDIASTYFMTPFRRIRYNVSEYTGFMIDHSSSFLMGLYKEGARNIGVISVAPVGCVPLLRTLHGGSGRECSEHANRAAKLFNSKLSSKLKDLHKQLAGSKFVYIDMYGTLLDMIHNHTKYGFEVGNKGCCGTGHLEFGILCNGFLDPATCKDDTKYVFWDSFHPTERAYEVLTNEMFAKYKSQLLR